MPFTGKRRRPISTWLVLAIALSLLGINVRLPATSLEVKIKRWLTVRQVNGQVFVQNGKTARPATVGSKLHAIGDSVRTGDRASAILEIDTDIAFVKMAEKTTLTIKHLRSAPDGGKITQLEVPKGQARLQVRPFTHPSSKLNVVTPAGVSSVRGTEFGMGIQPNGKTGVATMSGSVVTTAQGRSVQINAGTQSFVLPGEAPVPPVPLKDDPAFVLETIYPISGHTVFLAGSTDPVNSILVNNQPQNSDRTGRFQSTTAIPADRQVTVTIMTPLGKRQDYRYNRPQ